jgi:hypothetical protein
MLLKPSDDIRECDGHAMEARQKADSAPTAETRESFLEMERRWLFLAHSYEFSERISRFTASYRGTR